MISLIIILLIVIAPICGQLLSVPYMNPSSCSAVTAGGQKYSSFFNSVTMNCTPCSQTDEFQQRSKDGQFLRATAECFARLCHRLGVCLSVCHTQDLYQNGAS